MSSNFNFRKQEKAEMLYWYLPKHLYFREVAEKLYGRFPGVTARDISEALRDTGVSGSENNRGRSFGGHGTSSDRFSNGVYVRKRDGQVLRADINLFMDYYTHRSPGQPLIDYLENGPIRVTPKKAGTIVAGVVGAVILGDAIGLGNFVDIGRVDVFDRTPSRNTTFKEDFVDEAKDIATDKVKDTAKDAAVGAVKAKLGSNQGNKATKKEPGIFDYNGSSYLGRISGKKPYKVCFELNQHGLRALGNYKGGELDGYGVRYDARDLDVGEFKNGELNGIGVSEISGKLYVGKFKGGELIGYGVRIEDNRKYIVKASKKGIKEIGYVDDNTWSKMNSKSWKVKNNTYKGIRINGNSITMDDIEIDISNGYITYYGKEADLILEKANNYAMYNELKHDEKGTRLEYSGDTILGEYHDVNVRVSTSIRTE